MSYCLCYNLESLLIENIIYLTGWGGFMSTYEEFMIIINTTLLIIAILNYTHKK